MGKDVYHLYVNVSLGAGDVNGGSAYKEAARDVGNTVATPIGRKQIIEADYSALLTTAERGERWTGICKG